MRFDEIVRLSATRLALAAALVCQVPFNALAIEGMEDLSAEIEDMPDLSAEIPDDLGDREIPATPNKWSFRSGVQASAQDELRTIESRLSENQRTATALQNQYFQLTQQYQTLSVKYAALSQQYAGGVQQLQQLQQMGYMLQMQGQQVQQALQQAQMACNYGNQQACWQMQQLVGQYQALVAKYQQLEQQYNYIAVQLREIAASGHQLQIAGANIERTAADIVRGYQRLAVQAEQSVSRYQALKLQVASAVADADSPGLDYAGLASRVKKSGSLANLGMDMITKGLKAGLGAGIINREEIATLKGSDVGQTVDQIASLAQKTTQVLKDVGLLK